jgi:3-oxoadipate enol-lactonase
LLKKITTTKGVEIAYSIEGSGPWLTLSHSLASNMTAWDPQISLLKNYFKVLRFDTRGHGCSSAPEDPYTLDEITQDAFELLQQLDVQQTHWVGLSMGGMIGQTLVLKYPQLLCSLVLADTTSRRPDNARQMWGERIASAKSEGMHSMVESTIRRWFSDEFIRQFPEVIKTIAVGISTTSINGFAGCCEAISHINTYDRLKEITCPTLIMVGEQDHGTPPEMAYAMKEQMSKARLRIIPNAGHISNIEQSTIFNQHLIDFYMQEAFIQNKK